MSNKRALILILLLGVNPLLPAYGCELDRFFFGTDIATVRSYLQIGATMVDGGERTVLAVSGKEACQWDDSFSSMGVEFLFLYNKLVQIKISTAQSEPVLYHWALKRYGEFDQEGELEIQAGDNRQLFRDEMDKLIFYSIRPLMGSREESVEITSKRHDPLFRKYYLEVEQLLEGAGGGA